ncbi:uncharacterized protein LOC134752512 [Cydia strobilella]|uniref:uncharacterized protein LOC134752512 n=1 Tax=Cydia strobilella TaxID=1100964 RepID=UPI003006ACBC
MQGNSPARGSNSPVGNSNSHARVSNTHESWRGVARLPSRESVTTDLSLFSVSSAASDARALRLLACKRLQRGQRREGTKTTGMQGNSPARGSNSPVGNSNSHARVSNTHESWRGVARLPSRESVTTDLSLFSVSSAASDARALRLLACKAGQGPDPNLRVASPHPESKLQKRPSSGLPLQTADACKSLLAGCAALCAALGLRRSLSADDVTADKPRPPRSATSEVGLCAALEALTLSSASRSCSTWVAVGGSQLPSPQRASVQPAQRLLTDNKKIRQSYIKRRLLTTYKALERMSQSEFNLDKLEAAAVASTLTSGGGAGPTVLAVPTVPAVHAVHAVQAVQAVHAAPTAHTRFVHPEACALALTAADLERERGRPLSKYERNMMIFNWLHTLDDQAPF